MIILNSFETHEKKIESIQQKLKKAFKDGSKTSLHRHTSNTMRDDSYKKAQSKIDLSSLNQVLAIDSEKQFVIAEPCVTMFELAKTTLEYGYVPKVLPEFCTITVGGAIMGAALESSSHRYGQFNDICIEYEILLASGKKLIASSEENRDLFYGISGSYGTLAYLTLAKIELVPAKKYVKLRIERFNKLSQLLNFFEENRNVQYIEGSALNESLFIGITGELSSIKEKNHYSQKHYFSTWFTSHLFEVVNQFQTYEETIPILEYLFRYDRGAFWIGYYLTSLNGILKLVFQKPLVLTEAFLKVKKNYKISFLFRLFFGWLFTTKRLYKAWHGVNRSDREKYLIIQDFYTPNQNVETFYEFVKSKTKIFPLAFGSIKAATTPQYCSPHYSTQKNLIDVCVYGRPFDTSNVVDLVKDLEKENLRLGGKKMLYSFNYYDQQTFFETYGGEPYQKLREKFDAEKSLLTLYNKVVYGTENLHDKRPSHT